MKTINLQELITEKNLDVDHVAKHLFPKNKHPKLALNRVIYEEAQLDAIQVSKLAFLLDMEISDLYTDSGWKSKSIDNVITFQQKDFKATLNTDTWVTKIYHNDSLFYDAILHSQYVPLSEYINILNLQIKNYKKNGQINT